MIHAAVVRSLVSFVSCAACCAMPVARAADGPPGTKSLIEQEQQAMALLSGFDGIWRGPAVVTTAGGREVTLTQTERVGDLLDRSIKVIEGRGYAADGTLQFNAFGVLSFAPQTGRYGLRAMTQGYTADPSIEVSQDRFVWSLPAGPGATIRYTATVQDGVWTEIGERIVDGQAPVRVYAMTLRRVGDTDWPAAGAVAPQ